MTTDVGRSIGRAVEPDEPPVDIAFEVNGTPVRYGGDPGRTLIDVLREDLGHTGTKRGCGNGVCGACSVLIDGELQSSCLTLTVLLDGRSVRTVEGLATDGALSPVQESFVEHGGFQCGFCTPGQVVSATALLAETPRPTLQEVRHWMEGNICRCTGYYKIAEAVLAAADAGDPAP